MTRKLTQADRAEIEAKTWEIVERCLARTPPANSDVLRPLLAEINRLAILRAETDPQYYNVVTELFARFFSGLVQTAAGEVSIANRLKSRNNALSRDRSEVLGGFKKLEKYRGHFSPCSERDLKLEELKKLFEGDLKKDDLLLGTSAEHIAQRRKVESRGPEWLAKGRIKAAYNILRAIGHKQPLKAIQTLLSSTLEGKQISRQGVAAIVKRR